jgi:hypothetical protein
MTIIETGELRNIRYKVKLTNEDKISALTGLLVLVILFIIGLKIGRL